MEYEFPQDRLIRVPARSSAKEPLVLVACGSFSPVTFLHLRMFEMARDHIQLNLSTNYVVAGGYFSPVNDAYEKKGLALAEHRITMCQLAVQSSDWLMVDPFEARQKGYMPTAQVLDHFAHELNVVRGGVDVEVENEWGEVRIEKRKARIMLLAGSDLVHSFSTPGVWSQADLHHILGLYGCVIIERAGSEVEKSISDSSNVHSRSPLALYKNNIYTVEQLVHNDISSTKIRLFRKMGMSIMYLTPSEVARYIDRFGLYTASESRKNSSSHLPAMSQGGASTSSGLGR